MLAGLFEADDRSLMQADVLRDGHCVFSASAMNDVVVNRGATSGMVELRVEVDGNFVANQRADGLIISTSTGSTAYALSAGGPLLHPAIGGWVMVPIAPHTLSNRPIVLSDTSEIVIEIVAGRDASANFDMQSLASLMHGDRIVVTRSKHRVRFLHPKGWTYFDTLRKKMHWNEGPV
jgi:NAD+ kinase